MPEAPNGFLTQSRGQKPGPFSGARGRKPQRQPGLHVEAPQQMASPDLAASCRGTRRRWKDLLSFIDWPGRTLWKPKVPRTITVSHSPTQT
ncbi:hypothetical protein CapIbe_008920 [Capra ibex]